jgi:hypothetical protein
LASIVTTGVVSVEPTGPVAPGPVSARTAAFEPVGMDTSPVIAGRSSVGTEVVPPTVRVESGEVMAVTKTSKVPVSVMAAITTDRIQASTEPAAGSVGSVTTVQGRRVRSLPPVAQAARIGVK